MNNLNLHNLLALWIYYNKYYIQKVMWFKYYFIKQYFINIFF